MSLVVFQNEMWWKMWQCVIVVVRARCAVNDVGRYCSVLHARTQTSERVATIREWSVTFCMCVGGNK